MTSVAIVAAPRDGEFASAIRASLPDASLSASLPHQFAGKAILLWSAALDALHSLDAQALVGLWAEGRLVMVRRDATPLPLGLRDLDSLPPETKPKDIADLFDPKFVGAEAPAEAPAARSSLFRTLAILVGICVVLGGAYYYLTAQQRAMQAALTSMLELAAKASEELNKAKEAEVRAQLRLAEARAAELEAIKRADLARVKELEEVRRRAEAEAAKQAELVKQREAAAADARDKAKKAADNARRSASVKAEAAKTAVAEAPKVEVPKAESAKLEPPKTEVAAAAPVVDAPKAEAKAAAPEPIRVPNSRSEREAAREEEVAAKSMAPKSAVPSEPVVAASPSAPVPVDRDALFAQAQSFESAGRGTEAIRLYRRAARAGHGKAAKRLGDIYDRGIPGVPRDYQESLSWYQRARDLGEHIATAGRNGSPAPKAETPKPKVPEPAKAPEPAKSAPAPKSGEVATPAKPPAPPPAEEFDWIKVVIALAILALAAYVWRRSRKPVASPTPSPAPVVSDGATLFVSYSHKDKARIEPIVSMIEQTGRQVWMDRTGITGQAGWAGQIVRAIRQSRAVVLMASPNSYASDQVVRELYLAMNHKKPIVPIEIEPAELPDELQYILAPFQHHRLSGGETREVLGRALAAV